MKDTKMTTDKTAPLSGNKPGPLPSGTSKPPEESRTPMQSCRSVRTETGRRISRK
jgi:hypothetical protein